MKNGRKDNVNMRSMDKKRRKWAKQSDFYEKQESELSTDSGHGKQKK